MIVICVAIAAIIYLIVEIKKAPVMPDDYEMSKEEIDILKELKEKDESNISRP